MTSQGEKGMLAPAVSIVPRDNIHKRLIAIRYQSVAMIVSVVQRHYTLRPPLLTERVSIARRKITVVALIGLLHKARPQAAVTGF